MTSETELSHLMLEYAKKFGNAFPLYQLSSISFDEAVEMINDALKSGKPIEIPPLDDPDALY